MTVLADYVVQFRAAGVAATQASIEAVRRSMGTLAVSAGQHATSVTTAFERVNASTSLVARAFNTATAPVRSLGEALAAVINPLAVLHGIGLGIGQSLFQSFANAASSAIRLASSVETLAVSFRVLLGSEEQAATLMRDINRFAAETPFEQMQLADVARQLLAYGVGVDEVIATMRRLGDIAALSGARLEDLAAIYGKIRAQGRLTAETLVSWQARGIPITRELAALFGVAESQVRELVSEGRIGFAEVQEAIRRLTDAGGQFAGGMAELAKTSAGLWSTVTGNLKVFLAELGSVIIETLNVRSALAGVGAWLGTAAGSIRDLLAPLGQQVRNVITLVGDAARVLWTDWGGTITQFASTLIASTRAAVDAAATMIMWLWTAIVQPVFSTIGTYVSSVLESMAAGWRWLFGVTGEITGHWLTDWLASVQFVAENWQLGLQIMWEATRIVFTNIPAYFRAVIENMVNLAGWFARNWRDILFDAFNYLVTVATNAFTNIRNLVNSVLEFVRTGRWEIDWTPLAEGFQATLRELPQLTAPELDTGALDELLAEWDRRWDEFRARRQAALAAAEVQPLGAQPQPAAPTAGPPTPALTGPAAHAAARFVGFAELARQMQQDVARELQRKTAEATQRTADATARLAAAVEGGAIRVKLDEQVIARYA